MELSNSIISDDYFFIFGLSALLSQKLADDRYFIIDMKTADYTKVKKCACQAEKVFVLISNDLDYYALRHFENVTMIHRQSQLKDIFSCVIFNEPDFSYHVKNNISTRENEVLSYMQEGLDTQEIVKRLRISPKTFYSHRASLINKLNIGNRISLYKNIARFKTIN
ncbi:hypothetical protein Z042_24930 [Chania multitudinisentens RB-25]|uniref:HTH luxR-type domain-containing protein n=1 Tax=Chania multitudinisentens RB-25 TaxID=1441930 RepID=W0LKI6_9GAMM|nr:helix-turn-helix transcriptional regulator [Chania multitudinisentens]AHG22490.1 hypothetical protein Z042_24930 [Chania multitudinisentens RB-25]